MSRLGGQRRRRLLLSGAAVLGVVLAGAAVASTLDAGSPGAPAPAVTTPAPAPPPPPAATAAPVVDMGVPTHLMIDSIDVDAPVIKVGTTTGNAQDVPRSLTDTGWWRDGQRPGESGNAVVVGHTASSADGVFDRLGEVRVGDAVVVASDAGELSYRVTKVDDVDVDDFESVASDVYRSTGPSGLVLMTCGDYDGSRFLSTVIVHAEL